MPIPSNRVIFQGRLYTGEVWSAGMSLADVTNPSSPTNLLNFDALQEWANDVMAYVTGLASGNILVDALSTQGFIDRVRIEARSDNDIIQVAESTAAAKQGTSTPAKPAQISLVCSFLTGRPGRSYRGRMYWPALGRPTIGSDGHIIVGDATAASTAFAALATAVMTTGAQPSLPWTPSLVVASVSKQVVTPVTAVSVGNVLDTQRRRRDALAETYTTTAI